MIEINNITKVYKKGTESFTALEDVSFKIGKGDYVAVNGPSGAGKSTVLYTIGGLIHPDSGTVMFNGNDLYGQSEKFLKNYRKNHVGFVFQQFHLMPYLTVLENIRLNDHRKQAAEIIDSYLEKCSIAELTNKYPSELSVGEKQRTAFIRAIISDPEILLADEPTGNLDPENSAVIMQLIKEYNDKGGTVILVSHNPEAIKYANRVVSLEKGKLMNSETDNNLSC
jgi:ABC-type lipoprotein export system ATPase subunit